MQDANGSRFALVLGRDDWGRCRLADTRSNPALDTRWRDPAAGDTTPLAWDENSASVTLAPRTGRFRAGSGDLPPDPARRLGAAADAHGNVYAIVDGGARIEVRSAGSGRSSVFWPPPPPEQVVAPGAFGPSEPPAAPPALRLAGLAVTTGAYLVAGLVPEGSASGGLLVFDLLAGGPPLELAWPAPWRLVPHDMAPRRNGGIVVLDREQGRVWRLNRKLGMEASYPVAPGAPTGFTPADGSPATPAAQPWFELDPTAGADPVALEVLDDDAVIVLDGTGREGFATVALYVPGSPIIPVASTRTVLEVLAEGDRQGFTLRGFDIAPHAGRFGTPQAPQRRLVVVSHEGNQAFAFDIVRAPGSFALAAEAGFLPLKRYGGARLASSGRVALEGDTGLLYDSLGAWLPLVVQRRPRYQSAGTLWTELLDGRDPGCPWHRLMLDACIPSGCRVSVATRCADDAARLPDLPFEDEPLPVLRPDGSELPWLLEGPGARTDAAQGHGTWELLLQRARGRWLQVQLRLEGNELATPRLAALRAWRPRFSYAQHYLPGVWREDGASADFLERFLALFEGSFTTLEDRIAAASALVDVRSAPPAALDWLAGWLGLVLDPSLPEPRRRQLIDHAVRLYQYRGTSAALRLSVRLALSPCVPDADFALPAPTQDEPYGVRIVESFLTRRLPPALLGETSFADTPRRVREGARWSLDEGAEGLHRRWRHWLAQAQRSDDGARYAPLPPDEARRALWEDFSAATLGAVPQLAQQLDAAWKARAGAAAELPQRWPADGESGADAARKSWGDFVAGLNGPLARWLHRWQDFIARRHHRIEDYTRATGANWPVFALAAPPTRLPANTAALADWALFEARVEPIAAHAHAFSVLLPISGPQADTAALAQQIDLAQRVARLAKPAHTRFDVRPYWALFRLGQVRLGLDTLLGDGSRGLAPPLVLGTDHLGAARVAPRPDIPADRLLLEC